MPAPARADENEQPGDRRRPRRVYSVGTEPDPRFTLANERTLLAWLRTCLAFVLTGVAAVALKEVVDRPLLIASVAVAACAVGTVAAIGAYLRWQRIEIALRLRRPIPSPRLAGLLVAALVVLGGTGLAVLLSGPR